MPLILYAIGKSADGFARRSLIAFGWTLLPFIAISWTNIFKFLDLIIGRKINLQITDYQIERTKDGFVLKTRSPYKAKFNLYDSIPSLIKQADPITIEIAKLSKTLLYISQNGDNLLERIENEDKLGESIIVT